MKTIAFIAMCMFASSAIAQSYYHPGYGYSYHYYRPHYMTRQPYNGPSPHIYYHKTYQVRPSLGYNYDIAPRPNYNYNYNNQSNFHYKSPSNNSGNSHNFHYKGAPK